MLGRLRARWGWLDHLFRAAARYKEDCGDRLAAAVTYYGFLSLFPLLLLGVSVLGFVLAGDPLTSREVVDAMQRSLPGVGEVVSENLASVTEHRRGAGLIGLAGLTWSGLGWVSAFRESLRAVWHQDQVRVNIAKRKLLDLLTLAGLGLTLLVSLGVVAAGSALFAGTLVGPVVSLALGLVADTLLFGYLFTRLPRSNRPLRRVLRGALFGAAGFALLKGVGTFYVARTVTSGAEVYGTFAVVVGLLVWINLASRFTLFAAAWTVTGERDSDVRPSGTAEPYPQDVSGRIRA
jgi:membrane protein